MVKFGRANFCAGSFLKRALLLSALAVALGLTSFAIQFSAARPTALVQPIEQFASGLANFEVLDRAKQFGRFSSVAIRLIDFEFGDRQLTLAARGELFGGAELQKLEPDAVASCRLELKGSSADSRAGFGAKCLTEIVIEASPALANQWAGAIRSSFSASLVGVDGDSAGLVAGLAIGETSGLSPELLQDMKSVSLTHLTAVSGANCAIVLAMVYFLLKFVGAARWFRIVIGLLTLFGYVLLVGAQPSVLRAAVMSSAVLLSIGLGRKSSASSGLALAVIVLLIADPWLATDFGFALSVAATFGILFLSQPIAERLEKHLPRWLALGTAVTLAAQVLCLPVLLQLQNGLASFSILANLVAGPLVAPITVLGMLACVISPAVPWLATGLAYLASLGAWLIKSSAHYFASLPNQNIDWPTGLIGAVAAAAVAVAFFLWLKTEPTKLRNIGLVALVVISSLTLGSFGFRQVRNLAWPLADWQVVACDVGQGDSLVVRSQSKIAVIDVGRDNLLIDGCLDRLGVQHIDLLVLTHFDFDHVGGLRGALGGRTVGACLISPFKDQREAATESVQLLTSRAVSIEFAKLGQHGKLAAVNWQVLSPTRDAVGLPDSNSASVVMLWQFSEFNLLTMADVGESAQLTLANNSSLLQQPTLQQLPLVLKVSHHGSADQSAQLIRELDPELSLISVGQGNSYGHPTIKTLDLLSGTGSQIARTDQSGSISIAKSNSGLVYSVAAPD